MATTTTTTIMKMMVQIVMNEDRIMSEDRLVLHLSERGVLDNEEGAR
jgi:hypothetical protein